MNVQCVLLLATSGARHWPSACQRSTALPRSRALRIGTPQADRRALNITLNSIGTELTRDDRKKLYSNFGLLYPHGQVGFRQCDAMTSVFF